jgi:hypothetical protein
MRPAEARWLLLSLWCCASCGSASGDACNPEDADGVIGGSYTFDVTVDDSAFSHAILKAQNRSEVTVALTNEGTVPHGFLIECLATPNEDGCPTESCFPDAARIDPLPPGATGSASFEVPRVEGIYVIRSVEGEPPTAQFIVQ